MSITHTFNLFIQFPSSFLSSPSLSTQYTQWKYLVVMILFCSIDFLIVVNEFYSVTFLSVLFLLITYLFPQPMTNSFLSTHYSTQYKTVTFLLCSIT